MSRFYNNMSSKTQGHALADIPTIVNKVDGKRYYSSLDAEIFFGSIYIDEITSIIWNMNQQVLPIYGYNSYTFDDLATGTRMVQGQFATNFIQSAYLQNIQNNKAFVKVARTLYNNEKIKTSAFTSEYRKQLNLPIWDKGFDIVIAFGDHGKKISNLKQNEQAAYVILDCVQITGSSSMLDVSGEPVQEIYTFIARDMRVQYAVDSRGDLPTEEINNERSVERSVSETEDVLEIQGKIELKESVKITLSTNSNDEFMNGTISLLNYFSNKNLNATNTMVLNGKELIYIFSKEDGNILKQEIKKNNYKTLKANIDVNIKNFNSNFNKTEILKLKIE